MALGGHGRRTRPSSDQKEAAIAVKEEKLEMEGEIVESLRSGMFRITLDNGHQMIGYTAGKMKRYRIRMAPGDRVKVEVSLYDLDRDASSTECGSVGGRSSR